MREVRGVREGREAVKSVKSVKGGKAGKSGKAAKPGKSGKPELMPMRWRERDGRVLLTNDCGDYAWLERKQLDALMDGTLRKDRATWDELTRRNMIRSPQAEDAVTERLRRRSHHLFSGTSLHIVVLTLRCDHTYLLPRLPAAGRRSGFDMTRDGRQGARRHPRPTEGRRRSVPGRRAAPQLRRAAALRREDAGAGRAASACTSAWSAISAPSPRRRSTS